ncbi:hypothetical protein JOQ06_007330, partial [Pogonophryne albipinna]
LSERMKDLVATSQGRSSFKASVGDITDAGDRGKSYKRYEKIQNSPSVEILQDLMIRNSAMLQTAGCFRQRWKICSRPEFSQQGKQQKGSGRESYEFTGQTIFSIVK